MRFRSVVTWCLVMLAVALPTLVLGQDTTAAGDSILPPQPPAAGSGLCGFLDPYQMPLVQALSAIILYLAALAVPAFREANDWLKRLAAFVAGFALSFGLGKLGCTPNPELTAGGSAALSGAIAALVNWLMFKIAKTQPST